ncbi:MAG: methyltransferase domain-containing protein [Verrucomicrobia bacterium]|nr:methyltransferase domain-containing protein [Verrucomicrobiota bacterium]
MKKLTFLTLCFCQALFGISSEELPPGWDAATLATSYFHNSELQRQWAWEVLGKVRLTGNEKILDFGCGDGKISAELSRLVPKGSVIGVDTSSAMIDFASVKFPSYAYPRLQFKKIGSPIFGDTAGSHEYDVICAFSVFHQITDPLATLKNLRSHLRQDGKLLLVIPTTGSSAFFQAASEMFSHYHIEAPWNRKLSPDMTKMLTLEGCSSLLHEAGFDVASMETIDTDNPFYSEEELTQWMVAAMSPLWRIPQSISHSFFKSLVSRLCALDPDIIDAEGRIHFKLSRLRAIATPPLEKGQPYAYSKPPEFWLLFSE